MNIAGEWTLYLLAAVFLYVLPGWGLLEFLWGGRALVFFEKLGLSAALSLCLYPILMLYSGLAAVKAGPFLAWGPGSIALLSLVFKYRKRRRAVSRKAPASETDADPLHRVQGTRFVGVLSVVTVCLLLATRLAAVRGMSVPAWGDSVQHTFAVQRILESGGLFQSWAPYAPIASFTYHFGFHASAAAWAWLTGLPAPQAVLVCGQVINVLAVLAFFPLVVRLSGTTWAGLAAILLAGFLMQQPGYFVNWGRYTQLAGQVILLGVLWFFDVVWSGDKKPRLGTLALLFLLILGVPLTHVRVAVIMAVAAVCWGVWGIWHFRKTVRAWAGRALAFSITALAAAVCAIPWIKVVLGNRFMIHVIKPMDGMMPRTDIELWQRLDFYYGDGFWVLAVLGFLLALRFLPRLAWPVGLWCGLTFLAANPFLIGIKAGRGFLNNEVLVLALYIPLALIMGGLLGEAWRTIFPSRLGKGLILAGLALGLSLGTGLQIRIVDPRFQMVTESDLSVFGWIKTHVPENACFLVNGFLAFDGDVAVGSDAGWWLPFYARRANTMPPALYYVERLEDGLDRDRFRRIITDVRATTGDPKALREILVREKISHVFLGEKRGSVGYQAIETVPELWLRSNPDFSLLHQQGKAQVWRFNGQFPNPPE